MYIDINLNELRDCRRKLVHANADVGIGIEIDDNIDIDKSRLFKMKLTEYINDSLAKIINR